MRRLVTQLTLTLLLACLGTMLYAQQSVKISENTIELNGRRYILHKVNKGETIYSIARAYDVPQIDVMTVNNLTRDNIKRSQTLLIPVRSELSARNANASQQAAAKSSDVATTTTAGKNSSNKVATTADMVAPTTPAAPKEAVNLTPASDGTNNDNGHVTATVEPSMVADATPKDSISGMREFIPGEPLNVAIFLPLNSTSTKNENFTDYYRGTLVGLNTLKNNGISVNVKFINSAQTIELLRDNSPGNPLQNANLIIGPIYPEQFAPMAAYAAANGVPIVNPLGTTGNVSSPYVFEASPVESAKYDKLVEMMLDPAVNAIVIDHVEWNDPALDTIIEKRLTSDNISMIPYTSLRAKTKEMDALLSSALDKTRENVIFVPVSRDNGVEEILSRLSSINTLGHYRITVIGTPSWSRLGSINQDMFFKLKVHYPTSYHADRLNPAVSAFYKEYISNFGILPSPYSFRGNDVIRYFAGAMNRFGTNMISKVKDYNPELLQVSYRFVQDTPQGKHENRNWVVTSYNPDYTIRVK